MKKYKLLPALTGALLAITSLTSQAGIISGWGAYASTSTGDDCKNGCGVGSVAEYTRDGGHLSTFATSEENTYGESKALVDLTGPGYLPTLKVLAKSTTPGKRAGAKAFAAQGFDYLGNANTTLTLNLNLHGSVSGDADLSTHIGILIGDDWGFYPGFATGYYEGGLLGGLKGGGTEFLSIQSGLNVNKLGSISFNLNPGESFYILSEMNASAYSGIADAWNTLTMKFSDDSNLRAAIAPINGSIPEPSILLLMVLGLGFIYRKQTK